MANGIYRFKRNGDDWVATDEPRGAQGLDRLSFTRDTYTIDGYQPAFDELPTQEEYEARNA